MAVGKDKQRLSITFTKNQVKWLTKLSKKSGASISRLVRFLINKDLTRVIEIIERKNIPMDDLLELYRIAQTPWLDDDDND